MAQVKKLQTGTGSAGIQPKKLQFKVNGNAYEKDEQFLKDQFEPIFNDMVAAGNAKARDKDLWQKSFSQYLGQARTGGYSLETSGDKFMSGSFAGAPDAELGLNEDGSTAKKTQVGEIISPRKRSDDQRMALLNTMIGNKLAGAWQTDQASAKAKAEADKLKADGDHRKQALSGITNFHRGFGFNRFGDDFNTAKALTLDKYWDKGVTDNQRRAMLMEANTNLLRGIFNPELDKYKDDEDVKALLNNRSLDEVRGMANKVYDPTSGKFLYDPKTLGDFQRFSNITDTMGVDNLFYDRKAWMNEKNGQAGNTGTTVGGGKVGNNTPFALKKTGNIFSDGKRAFGDVKGQKPLFGMVDGTLYNNGEVYNGAYIGNDESGNQDYNSTLSGYYWKGKPIKKDAYEAQYRALESQGEGTLKLRQLLNQRNEYVSNFYKGYFTGKGGLGDTKKYIREDEIQDKDASDYIFSDYVKHDSFSSAQNLTNKFTGFPGAVAAVRNDKKLDQFGNPIVENVVRLKGSGKTYVGRIVKDYATNKHKMLDRSGKEIKEVSDLLRKATLNDNAEVAGDFRYNWDPATEASTSQDAFQDLGAEQELKFGLGGIGVQKKQLGGTLMGKPNTGTAPKVHKQATVKDIGTAVGSNYELSTLDKVELGALAGDLAGTLASFTGAGSVVSGGLGVASTLAQGYIDYARDGEMSGGDWAALGTGLALDAASFIPGLGAASSTSKTLRTITKTAKVLVPMLTAAGLVHAAGIVGDVAFGKKKITDLSVDDLRGIVSGIHAVVGGTRLLGQKLATKNAESRFLTLKNGQQVPITSAQATSLDNAEDKVAFAKSLIKSNKPEMALEDIVLGDTKKFQPKIWKGLRKTVEDSNAAVTVVNNGKTLKSLDDYQGNSLWDKYMKGNIKRAAKRDASLDVDNINNDLNPQGRTGMKNATIGVWGDYFNRRPKRDLLELPGPSGEPLMGNNTRWLNQTAGPSNETGNGYLKFEDGGKLRFPLSNGLVSFKSGGVVKLQAGKTVPFLNANPWVVSNGTPLLNAQNPSPYEEWNMQLNNIVGNNRLKPSSVPSLTSTTPSKFNKIVLPGQTVDGVYGNHPGKAIGSDQNTPRRGLGSRLMDLTKGIDPLNASELGRALYTRELNSRIDTKVERPMLSTPQEISVPVRGNMLAQNAYDQQANTVIQNANVNKTSDAMLNTASNLAANQQASQLRMQGAMVNNESLERTRAANLENQMKTSQVRNEVANQNMQTNARATQAERQAGNEKQAKMAQPILDYWKNSNYEGMVRREQNRSIDGQLFQISEQNKVQPQMSSLEAQNNAIDMKLYNSPNLSEQERADLVKQQTLINGQYQQLATRLQQAMLMYRKQPGFTTGNDYYKLGANATGSTSNVSPLGITRNKEGGAVKMAVENQKQEGLKSREISKQQQAMLKQGLEDDTKRTVESMRQIQELIKLALS